MLLFADGRLGVCLFYYRAMTGIAMQHMLPGASLLHLKWCSGKRVMDRVQITYLKKIFYYL